MSDETRLARAVHPQGHTHPRHASPRPGTPRVNLPNVVEFTAGEVEALREYRDLRLSTASSVSYTERAVHDRAYQVIDRVLAPSIAAESFREGRASRARTLSAELTLALQVKDAARVGEIAAELTELGARYVDGQGYVVD